MGTEEERKARENDPVASLLRGLVSMLQKILRDYIEKGEVSIADVKLLIKGFLQLLESEIVLRGARQAGRGWLYSLKVAGSIKNWLPLD